MSYIPVLRRRKAEINIVPLVDVLIVLIFFFLVSMQFRNMATLNIVLPKIETAGKSRMLEQIEIGISPEGQFYYNGEPLTSLQIEAAIKLAANFNKDTLVLILADEESYLKHITFVMDTCRKAGLDKIRLQSR